MPRAIRDMRLETRTAREKLKPKRDPYWRAIDRGAHLGYRKGKTGGFWIARYRGPDRKYSFRSLGMADDAREADSATVLDFFEAQDRARQWFAERGRKDNGLEANGPYTVADAMRDYLAWYQAHRKALADVTYRTNAFILPILGETKVAELTTKMIREWHEGLAAVPARKRTAPGHEQQYRDLTGDEDSIRRRRASANKILTILKAALNHANRDEKILSDNAWRRVKAFRNVDAAKVRYLTEAEIVRLVNTCAPDFRQLVRAALLSGCRYGELAAMRCRDFDPDAGMVYIGATKSGKDRHVTLTDEGRRFFEQVVTGQPDDDVIFPRADGKPWAKSHQRRPLAEACKRAGISPPASFHVLRHTHASHLAMRGVPLMVIAHQLGHSDSRMAEKHYAHLSPSYISDAIRAGLPDFGIVEESSVTLLKAR